MAKGKEARHIIKLKSEASDHCYFTQKNKNNSKERHPAAQVRPDRPQARHVQGSQQAVTAGPIANAERRQRRVTGGFGPLFLFAQRAGNLIRNVASAQFRGGRHVVGPGARGHRPDPPQDGRGRTPRGRQARGQASSSCGSTSSPRPSTSSGSPRTSSARGSPPSAARPTAAAAAAPRTSGRRSSARPSSPALRVGRPRDRRRRRRSPGSARSSGSSATTTWPRCPPTWRRSTRRC